MLELERLGVRVVSSRLGRGKDDNDEEGDDASDDGEKKSIDNSDMGGGGNNNMMGGNNNMGGVSIEEVFKCWSFVLLRIHRFKLIPLWYVFSSFTLTDGGKYYGNGQYGRKSNLIL
jgi:hypothetical protein